jgi:hypothetical protein
VKERNRRADLIALCDLFIGGIRSGYEEDAPRLNGREALGLSRSDPDDEAYFESLGVEMVPFLREFWLELRGRDV